MHASTIIRRASSLAALFAFAVVAQPASAATKTPIYKDATMSVDARVEDLLSRMTLAEKVAQMRCIWEAKAEVFDTHLELDPVKMAQRYPDGIGQFARPSDATGPKSPRVFLRRSGWPRVGIPALRLIPSEPCGSSSFHRSNGLLRTPG